MSSLKRKYKVDAGKNAKMKLTCDSFHEEFLKSLEKFRTTDDCKVQNIFEEHAIRNTDKKTLQKLSKIIENGLCKSSFILILFYELFHNLTKFLVLCLVKKADFILLHVFFHFIYLLFYCSFRNCKFLSYVNTYF